MEVIYHECQWDPFVEAVAKGKLAQWMESRQDKGLSSAQYVGDSGFWWQTMSEEATALALGPAFPTQADFAHVALKIFSTHRQMPADMQTDHLVLEIAGGFSPSTVALCCECFDRVDLSALKDAYQLFPIQVDIYFDGQVETVEASQTADEFVTGIQEIMTFFKDSKDHQAGCFLFMG